MSYQICDSRVGSDESDQMSDTMLGSKESDQFSDNLSLLEYIIEGAVARRRRTDLCIWPRRRASIRLAAAESHS